MNVTLQIAELEFEIRRTPRRRTLGLTVDRGGELIVHAPESADDEELRRWIERKLLWVHRKLAQKREMNTAGRRSPEFVSGESFFYLGKNHRLRLVDDGQVPLELSEDWFRLRRQDLPEAANHFRKWYVTMGTSWLVNRVEAWVPRTNARPGRITVGDLGYHWGSCGRSGALHFNWRLLQLPVRLIDYVVVHELIHLIRHDHSREYWRVLDRVLPDWQQRKAMLESAWQTFAVFRIERQRVSANTTLDAAQQNS